MDILAMQKDILGIQKLELSGRDYEQKSKKYSNQP